MDIITNIMAGVGTCIMVRVWKLDDCMGLVMNVVGIGCMLISYVCMCYGIGYGRIVTGVVFVGIRIGIISYLCIIINRKNSIINAGIILYISTIT